MTSPSRSGSERPGRVSGRRAVTASVLAGLLFGAIAPALRADDPRTAAPAFWGTRLINLPTSTLTGKGEVLFRISHRFIPKADSGYDAFYGFDGPAAILFGLGFGITDDLEISLERSNIFQVWELAAGWRVLETPAGAAVPLAAVIGAGVGWASQRIEGRDRTDSRNFRLNLRASLSARLTGRWTVLAVPSLSTHTNHWTGSPSRTIALGLGTRYLMFKDISVIAEWTPVAGGYKAVQNGWGVGLEKKIGGHVFQVFVANSIGLTSAQSITGGDLRLQDADFRFGFNIFRSF